MSVELIPIWQPNACTPRKEVLKGTLTDAELALSLSAITGGRAKPPYNNPVSFFQSTHLTTNMKTILESVLGRLSKSKTDVNPIIVLDVGFGGGKTHTLVTIFYAAIHPDEAAKHLAKLPQPSNIRVVALSGDEYGSKKVQRRNQIIRTIWGDIFWQLGVYENFAQLDKEALIPSLEDVRKALEGNPVLILLDELPTYFKVASSDGLLDKAVQFLQRLTIAVSEKEDAAMIIAIAEDAYKHEAEEARRAIAEAVIEAMEETRAHIRRKETVLVPVAEEDVVHILKRRLFENIPTNIGDDVADAYHQMYSRLSVPDKWKSKAYRDSISEYYPFHPELIRVLYDRLATIDRFHRTRGALRLLSRMVRRIWNEKESDAMLIHPFHVDLAEPGILDDLTTGIGEERRRNAAEADIWSSRGDATAQEKDAQSQAHWGAPLVRRTCNTIYIYSLAAGREGAQGIASDLLTALCTTPQRPDHYLRIRDTVLTYLIDSFQFIDRRGERYVFVKEPTPSRVIEQLSRDITEDETSTIISDKLATLFSGDPEWVAIEPFPSNPSKIYDQAYIKVAILNPNIHTIPSGILRPPEEVSKFLLYKDEYGKRLRQYSNSIFLLVASADRLDLLRLAARRLKAARMVQENLFKYSIPKDRKRDVAEIGALQEKYLDDYLRAAFSNLVYHDISGPQISTISSSGYGSAKSGNAVVAHQLVNAIQRVKENSLDPDYVVEYAWPKGAGSISTKSLYEQFHSVPGLILPATKELFQETIKRGIDNATWVLKHEDKVYTHEKKTSIIPIDETGDLYTIEEADKLGLLKTKIGPTIAGPAGDHKPVPGAKQELITAVTLGDAPVKILAEDLGKKAHRDRFNEVNSVILKIIGKPMHLINFKNLFTRLAPEKEITARLTTSMGRPHSPKFNLNLDLTKEESSLEEGKSLLDLAWRMKGVEYCEMTLTLEWEKGSTPEKVSELLRSLGEGAKETLIARLEAKVSRRV